MNDSPETAYGQSTRQVSPSVMLGEDGVLRWVYELNMWRNPTLIITIGKVLAVCALLPGLLIFFLALVEGDGFFAALLLLVKISGIIIAIITGLLFFAYLLVGFINRGRYCVIFEMDDHGVKHIQMSKQFKKAQALSMLAVLTGAVAGNITATGAGLLAGSRRSLYSAFRKVKSVTVNEKRQVIYVNEALKRNQVYADAADFAFIRDHILARCPQKVKVKVIGGGS